MLPGLLEEMAAPIQPKAIKTKTTPPNHVEKHISFVFQHKFLHPLRFLISRLPEAKTMATAQASTPQVSPQ
jgi:hypothetical protein